jgi:acyl-CoA thioesterase
LENPLPETVELAKSAAQGIVIAGAVLETTDWLFYEQTSTTGVAGRALATGAIYNRAGDLVCTAAQEIYFPPPRES